MFTAKRVSTKQTALRSAYIVKARSVIAACAATILVALLALPAIAQTAGTKDANPKCTADDFAAAVDEAGASLRKANGEALPKIKQKLKQLKTAKGWADGDYEQKGMDLLHDARLAGYDAKANDLLARVDELGNVDENAKPDCAKLTELKAAGLELLAVLKAKSAYMLDKIDAEISPKTAKAKTGSGQTGTEPNGVLSGAFPKDVDRLIDLDAPTKPETATATTKSAASEKTKPATTTRQVAKPQPKPKPAATAKKPAVAPDNAADLAWDTQTKRTDENAGDLAMLGPQGTPTGPRIDLPPDAVLEPAPEGYTIDEIRAATRGFFGTISTSLASVLEHAFKTWGRPSAYVLGQEGGGAFLAGLRYGKGTLFPRYGESRKIYWHGPSVGYDFGAAGTRTMFLIYRMNQPEQIYRHFTGVDGSAFIVGGVGLTVLKGGPIIMTPIRTGLGLRIGANIGYVRFTSEATWNPF